MNITTQQEFYLSFNLKRIAIFSLLIFFICSLIIWIIDGGTWLYGLYSDVDGEVFAWYAKVLLIWSGPLDTLALNPFQGMGSIFLNYSPWWNPGSLVMALPFKETTNYVISYAVYWIEAVFSIYILARAIKLTKIESIFASQVFILFLFPVYSNFSLAMPLLSLAPLCVHFMAIGNLMVVLYLQLGNGSWVRNISIILLLLFGCLIFIFSAGFHVSTYFPIYALMCFGLMFSYFNKNSIFWKSLSIIFITVVLFALNVPSYYQLLSEYVVRGLVASRDLISFSMPVEFKKYNLCNSSLYNTSVFSILCKNKPPIVYFYFLAFIGGLVNIFGSSKKLRWGACSFCLIAILPDVLGFLTQNSILSGRLVVLGFYYAWATQPFYCIFFILFLSFLIKQGIKILSPPFSTYLINSKTEKLATKEFSSRTKKIFLVFIFMIIPAISIYILLSVFLNNPKPLQCSKETESVKYLHDQLSLKPNDKMRGYAASYFADENSSLRKIIQKDNKPLGAWFYTDVRTYLKKKYNNMYMFSDLWKYNIPTIEDYGQMISIPMFAFFQNLLAYGNEPFSDITLYIYKLNLKVLAAMGVRFLITDSILNDKNLSFVLEQKDNDIKKIDLEVVKRARNIFEELSNEITKKKLLVQSTLVDEFKKKLGNSLSDKRYEGVVSGLEQSALIVFKPIENREFTSANISKIKDYFYGYLDAFSKAPSLYLYEIKSSNIASFSPTQLIRLSRADEIFKKIQSPDFSFEQSVIIQENISKDLVHVEYSRMDFEPNRVRVQAKSKGWSTLLLPLQYSHCFKISSADPTLSIKDVQVLRANLVQTILLFHEKMDIYLNLDFGVGYNTNCKRNDILDMEVMKVKDSLIINR